MSENTSEDMSGKDVRKYVRNGCQKMMSEDMSKEMSIETSVNMSKKDVRRYVGKECQTRM